MAIRPDYTIGTITLTSGNVNFTTSGSSLQIAGVQAGDSIITRSGDVLIIATVTGQNAGTLFQPCPASAAGSAQPLRIRFQPDGSRYQAAARDLIARWGQSGNVDALAGLASAANTLPYFTGAGTADVTALTAWARTLLAAADGAAGYAALGAVPNANISNTLEPDKAYRRGNILGNVSQSGGVPTGGIIHRGSNANGEFVRFADGTQICWRGRRDVPVTSIPRSESGIPFQWADETWSFPASFSEEPNVSRLAAVRNEGGTVMVNVTFSNWTLSSSSVALRVAAPGTTPIGSFNNVSDIAIGRWF